MICRRCYTQKQSNEMYSNIWGITKTCKDCFKEQRANRLREKQRKQKKFVDRFNVVVRAKQ